MCVLEQGNEKLNRVVDVFDMPFRTEVLPFTYFQGTPLGKAAAYHVSGGVCVAVKVLLPDMVHSTFQVHVCMQGRSSKTSSLGKVLTLVGYFGASLIWFSKRQT